MLTLVGPRQLTYLSYEINGRSLVCAFLLLMLLLPITSRTHSFGDAVGDNT